MSVESAWDAELAAAGEAMSDDVWLHSERTSGLLAEIERLRIENAALLRVIHEGNRASHRVDL